MEAAAHCAQQTRSVQPLLTLIFTRAQGFQVDRFVPSRPKNNIPLNVTPRTNRISRQFGLTDNRVFNFKDNQENVDSNRDDGNMFNLLRRSVSSLFHSPPRIRPTSVTENLNKRKQCVLTLDGPGISIDPHACPITWSKRNLIAVACGNDIFYQNLNNRVVSHLCKLEYPSPSELRAIQWAGEGRESILASGSSAGVVQVWDAGRDGGEGTCLRMWSELDLMGVGGLDWNGPSLAVGSHDGTISLFDIREKLETKKIPAHKGKVLGVKWSTDGSYMASGDDLGRVYIWDKRAGKELLDEGTKGTVMRHRGPVKVSLTLILCTCIHRSLFCRRWHGVRGSLTSSLPAAYTLKARSASGVHHIRRRRPPRSKPSP